MSPVPYSVGSGGAERTAGQRHGAVEVEHRRHPGGQPHTLTFWPPELLHLQVRRRPGCVSLGLFAVNVVVYGAAVSVDAALVVSVS